MFKRIASAAALLIASSAAFAGQPNTFYAGADVGKTRFDEWSGRETSYGVFGGYNFHPNVAVEAGYRRLGEEKSGRGYKVSADQLALSVVGSVPVGESFSVYGRLGVNRLEGKVRYNGVSISDDTTKALLGVGVSYAFTPKVSGRLEFQKAGNDTRNLSAGVSYQF